VYNIVSIITSFFTNLLHVFLEAKKKKKKKRKKEKEKKSSKNENGPRIVFNKKSGL
jgi:hypothetical protein